MYSKDRTGSERWAWRLKLVVTVPRAIKPVVFNA